MKKKVFAAGAFAAAFCIAASTIWFLRILSTLPNVSRLKHYRPPAAAEVLDRKERPLTQYYDRSLRFWVPVTEIPELVIRSVVIAEDDTFFEHQGVNYKATWDALVVDMKRHRFARGGSTITQQMIKNVFLSKEKTLLRKLREYLLARQAEEILTKREILQIYLNEVEWGDDLYGIEAASRYYFDKHASELAVAESALLAGMLPNPRYYNPFKRPEKARDRRDQVLFNMAQARVITDEEYRMAVATPLKLRNAASGRFSVSPAGEGDRPCYQRVLEGIFLEAYGAEALYREGKRIRTTLDRDLQEMVRLREGTGEQHVSVVPERIMAVKEGADILAFACESSEEAVRSWVSGPGTPGTAYVIETMSPGALSERDVVAGPEPGADRHDP